jgi:hypothetical protein
MIQLKLPVILDVMVFLESTFNNPLTQTEITLGNISALLTKYFQEPLMRARAVASFLPCALLKILSPMELN